MSEVRFKKKYKIYIFIQLNHSIKHTLDRSMEVIETYVIVLYIRPRII